MYNDPQLVFEYPILIPYMNPKFHGHFPKLKFYIQLFSKVLGD